MINYAILFVTLVTLLIGLRWLKRTLFAGSVENMISKQEASLNKMKEDAKDPKYKLAFGVAWLISILGSSTIISIAIYVLANKLNFV